MDRNYTSYNPTNETAKIHLNYTDWRDHFDNSMGCLFRAKVALVHGFQHQAVQLPCACLGCCDMRSIGLVLLLVFARVVLKLCQQGTLWTKHLA
eukprot:3176128-Amphidinium_carterae.1